MTTYVIIQYENLAKQKISARQWEQYFKQNKIKKIDKKTDKPTKNSNKTIQNKKKRKQGKKFHRCSFLGKCPLSPSTTIDFSKLCTKHTSVIK